MTEAIHVQVLLMFLFEGDSEAARTGAEEAAGYLADRARRVLGTGVTGPEAAAAFARVFPPGWWELPPAVLATEQSGGGS